MNTRLRLFLILFIAGMLGVLTVLLLDVQAIIAILPIEDRSAVPEFTPVIKLLSLIQPAVILAAAVIIGIALAPAVGLRAPAAEAGAGGGDVWAAIRPQILPGIIGGIGGGGAIVLTAWLLIPLLPPPVVEIVSQFNKLTPLPTRLLYGGITEELLIRWGLMTFVVWSGAKVFRRGTGEPGPAIFAAAILISSLLFSIGHLPLAFLLIAKPTASLVLYVIVANSLFGVVAGFLYWKRGLESAIIAHIIAHLVMAIASNLGAYF